MLALVADPCCQLVKLDAVGATTSLSSVPQSSPAPATRAGAAKAKRKTTPSRDLAGIPAAARR